VISIIVCSIIFTALNILLSPYMNVNVLLLLDVLVWVLFNVWLTRRINSRAS
jgi:hypothetical protein